MSSKQLKTFRGMQHVQADYVSTGLSDTQFAELITKREKGAMVFSCAEVRQYRQSLGIANNGARDERDHKIVQLQNTLNEVWVFTQSWVPLDELRAKWPDLVARYEEAMK